MFSYEVQVVKFLNNFSGEMLAVGSWDPDNIKAEMYNDVSQDWSDLPDYTLSGTESDFDFSLSRIESDSIN